MSIDPAYQEKNNDPPVDSKHYELITRRQKQIEEQQQQLNQHIIQILEEARAAENKFRALLEAAPDAIVGIDVSGIIKLINTQTEIMFGYERDELLDQPIELLLPERFRGKHIKHRMDYVHTPHTRPMGRGMALFALRKDGSEFPVEISLSPLETDEGLVVTSIIRDVTERKQLEEQLRQHSADLEHQVDEQAAEQERLKTILLQSERLSALGRITSQISHEVRNPLSSIVLNLELLRDEIRESHTGDTSDFEATIQTILSQAERMERVLSDSLQFARKPIKDKEATILNDIIRDVVALIEPEAQKVRIEFVQDLNKELPTVDVDSDLISQVVINCVKNSMEAMPGGGTITISTCCQAGQVELAIRDTGTGISPEDQEQVFEPFYSTKQRGTGLGLPYVRQIIVEHGGHMQLDSQPGEGTTVSFHLPVSIPV